MSREVTRLSGKTIQREFEPGDLPDPVEAVVLALHANAFPVFGVSQLPKSTDWIVILQYDEDPGELDLVELRELLPETHITMQPVWSHTDKKEYLESIIVIQVPLQGIAKQYKM